jgi:hypothetical protein
MKFSIKMLSTMSAAIATVMVGVVSSAGQTIYSYDAALGTFPEAQAFQYYVDPGAPAPVVTNGVLHTFRFEGNVDQFWFQTNQGIDFGTTPYVLEATLHVVSADYYTEPGNTAVRSGYYLQAADDAGRWFVVGIASNGVTLHTDVDFVTNQAVQFMPFDSTSGFHTYRLIIENGEGTLYIDDAYFTSTPLGSPVYPGAPIRNRVAFGDASGRGVSEVELRRFRFAGLRPIARIEVSEVRICWDTITNRMYQPQYRSELTAGAWVDLGPQVPGTGGAVCVTDPVVAPHRFYQIVLLP